MGADRIARLVYGAAALAVLGLAVADRAAHYEAWRATPERHFAGQRVVSSADSYYWLRTARELAAPGGLAPVDALRDFPEGRPRGPTPLLARAIRGLADLWDADVYTSGMLLMIPLAGLFALPLAACGWRLGLPAAGLLGGLLGSFAPAYAARAGIHRIDTDGGNLFFVWLLAAALGTVDGRPATPRRRRLVLAALAGLALALFCRFYQQAGFWLVYVACFALHLGLQGLRGRRLLEPLAVFVLASNPANALAALGSLQDFVTGYLVPPPAAAGPLAYGHLAARIGELAPLPVARTLAGAVELPWLAALGVAGCAGALGVRWRRAAPFLPMLALALLAFTTSRRFAMYLAPLVGFGVGAVVDGIVHLAARERPRLATPRWRVGVAIAASAAVFAAAAGRTAFGHRPPAPSGFDVPLLAALERAGEALPPGALLVHDWWTGYLLQETAGAATLNDGLAPDPVLEHLWQRGLASEDPRWLAGALGAVAKRGRDAVRRELLAAAPTEWDAAIGALGRTPPGGRGVHVLVRAESLDAAPHYFRDGRWHPARGPGREEGFDVYPCRAADERLACRKADRAFELDPASGRVEGLGRLRRLVDLRVRPPRVREWPEPATPEGISAWILKRSGEQARVALATETVGRSTLSRLYLGDGDVPGWTLVHDAFPVLRVYRAAAP